MQDHPGVFIVLEGSDGAGKTTQFRLLAERLRAVGHDLEIIKFPRYGESSSYFVRQYLDGKYGPAEAVSPYTAAMFYALDRYEAAPVIRRALEKGKVVLSDRYVGATMAHQGAKFTSFSEQQAFFLWVESLEFQQLGIPRPNLNLFLKVPAGLSGQLLKKRAQLSKVKLDEHEKNIDHLEKAVGAYDLLCKLFPRDFREINCVSEGKMMSIVEINDQIWETIKPLLPPPKRRGKGTVLKLDEALVEKPKAKIEKADNVPKVLDNGVAGEPKKTLGLINELHESMLAVVVSDKKVNRNSLKEALQLVTPLPEKSVLVSLIQKPKAETAKQNIDEEPQSVETIIKEIATTRLPSISTENRVRLIERRPRNEFELLDGDLDNLTYQEKERKLSEEFNKPSSNILDRAVYSFDIVTDLLTLTYLTEADLIKKIKLKDVGPRYGHQVPEIIEIAGLENKFNKCFELANKLYSRLAIEGKENMTVTALLLGHGGRWQVSLSANALRSAHKRGKYSEFINSLVEQVAESHPLTATAIAHPAQSLAAAQRPRTRRRRKSRK